MVRLRRCRRCDDRISAWTRGAVPDRQSTKAFTAAVVLQLVGEERLSLEATAAELVGGVLEEGLGMDSHAVTIREMLNHTSGIPDVFPGQQPVPGERGRFLYSKVNYTLVGMIVESVTGSSLADQIDSRMSRPLGLMATTCRPPRHRSTGRTPGTTHAAQTASCTT